MIYITDYRLASTQKAELLDDLLYPQKVHWFPESYSRVQSGMFYPPHRVAEKVLDPELMKELRENPVGKTAFILAAGNSHFAGINPRNRPANRLTYNYKFLPFTLTQVYAGRIAQSCGATDMILTDATACASSLKVMMDVKNLIDNMGFNRVVVLTVEDQVSNSVLDFFGESRASLTWDEETKTGTKPSAFDEVNHGFYVAQGAAFAVFESAQVARRSCGRLYGAYTASESCSNAIGQREDGEGFKRAIEGALFTAGSKAKHVSLVKTHGTGTKSNNVAERAALEDTLHNFLATSYKPTIGHTMGASGLLETCTMLEEIRKDNKISGIKNRTSPDERYLAQDVEAPKGLILSLAAGMGNVYSAAVLSAEV